MSISEKPTITVSVTVQQPRQKVWQCWNEPEHITHWNFASSDWHCPRAENDLRPGGLLKSRMEAKDGSMGFDFGGIYEEVIPQEKIVLRMEDGRLVTTIFSDTGDTTTQITETFEAESENPIEMQRGGWAGNFE